MARLIADCPLNLYIVYTPGAEAVANGYEPWLQRVDNPFFNAIPGIHHYANWAVVRPLQGEVSYTYFDFQGLAAVSDLERVWFEPSLDVFREEWIRLWGYGAGEPPPVQRNVYAMRKVQARAGREAVFALITGGLGAPPVEADACWVVEETIRKHYQKANEGRAWRVPASEENLLGLDWLAITYGEDAAALAQAYAPGPETVAFTARLIAAPD